MPNRSLGHFDLIVMGAGSAGACAAIWQRNSKGHDWHAGLPRAGAGGDVHRVAEQTVSVRGTGGRRGTGIAAAAALSA